MLGKIELFDRYQDRLIKSFENDQLEAALEYAVSNDHIINCIFQQWDGDEDATLMFISVGEVKLTFDDGECPSDLMFF